jgi:hypothetical protein
MRNPFRRCPEARTTQGLTGEQAVLLARDVAVGRAVIERPAPGVALTKQGRIELDPVVAARSRHPWEGSPRLDPLLRRHPREGQDDEGDRPG